MSKKYLSVSFAYVGVIVDAGEMNISRGDFR